MKKFYVLIYTDFGDSCDGFARVFKTYPTKEEAQKEMQSDIKYWCKQNNMDRNEDVRVDYPDCVMMGDECRFGCQWQILEIEV